MTADQHTNPTAEPNDADPTEALLRATLGAAAARTDVTTPADDVVDLRPAATSARPVSNGRWLAAAAAALLVVGAGGIALRSTQDGGGVTEVGPSSGGAPSGSEGTTPPAALEATPAPPITTVGTAHPGGTQWVPILSFGYLPEGLQPGPVWRTPTQDGSSDGVLFVTQQMAPTEGEPRTAPPLGLTMYTEPDETFAEQDQPTTPLGGVSVPGNDGLQWLLHDVSGPVSPVPDESPPQSEAAAQAMASGGNEHVSIVLSGLVTPDELRRVVEEVRIVGWQDASTIPADPNHESSTMATEPSQPASDSQDIWPTEPPADYCGGWQEYLNVQANAPGTASVNTPGFVRYTTQLDALAPAEVAGEWARLRDLWSTPDKSSTSDDEDGSGAIHQHLYEVSMTACPGAALPNPS